MAPGAFVPAWKRLGLKLKKFEDTEPNQQDHQQKDSQTNDHHGSALVEDSSIHNSIEASHKLGKRKRQSDATDIEGETFKKSKHDQDDGSMNEHTAAVVDVEAEPSIVAASEPAPAHNAPVKGDPNNRKKKGGDPNYRKKDPKKAKKGQKVSQPQVPTTDSPAQPVQNLAPPRNPRTPSLSPAHTDLAPNGSTLLPSTEADHHAPASFATPQRQQNSTSSKENSSSLSPPKTDRCKSVTFTPDTKTGDGNSATNLFKKWVADQKGPSADFTPAEVAQFAEPPKVHIANIELPLLPQPSKNTTASKTKKDPSRYLNYLALYHQDRSNWKFNKAIQNDLLDNALNIFRIPEEYLGALIEYVKGLQGAGVIQRVQEKWTKAIEEIDEAERANPMDEREAVKEAALQERLSKERKRRRLEGDLENMVDHPCSEGYARRLKRSRAEALCATLKIPMPEADTPQSGLRQNVQQKNSEVSRPVAKPPARKRKSRTDISSDESSDSSSSEEESSSDEDESSDSDENSNAASASSDDQDDSSDADSDTDSSDGSGDSDASEEESD